MIHERFIARYRTLDRTVGRALVAGVLAQRHRACCRLGNRALVYVSFSPRDLLGLALGLSQARRGLVLGRADRAAAAARDAGRNSVPRDNCDPRDHGAEW